ncbi:MAG: hypothetical protein QOH96_1056 [Blastocatellia bacterium]|nr:hypothetical protein [Blastocatellia bacterium]
MFKNSANHGSTQATQTLSYKEAEGGMGKGESSAASQRTADR